MEDLENVTGVVVVVEFSYGFKESFELKKGYNIVSLIIFITLLIRLGVILFSQILYYLVRKLILSI